MKRKNRLLAERNRFGRQVIHAERRAGVPLTTKSVLTAIRPKLTRQIQWLKSRLEVLGGAVATMSLYRCSDSPCWIGWSDGGDPRFDKDEADRIIAWWNADKPLDEMPSYYDEDRKGYVMGHDMESIMDDELASVWDIIILADDKGRYAFDFMMWSEGQK